MKGNVKFFNTMKNYGFITADDDEDYFFHISGVEGGKILKEGDRVSFETEQGDRGVKAVNVKIVEEDEESPSIEAEAEEASSVEAEVDASLEAEQE